MAPPSDHPAILNVSDLNASFKSVANESAFVNIPLADLNGSSVLSSYQNPGTSWRNKLSLIILLVTLVGCISAIIYLCLRVEWVASLSGQVNVTLPVLGNVEGSFTLKEEGELSLSGKLSSLTPSNALWDQTYVDLKG